MIRKYSKARQENVFFFGFPVGKLLELINGRVCEKTDFGYDITLKPEEIPAEDGYEVWTKEVPVEAASRAETSAIPLSCRELEGAVCKKIREFPLEMKTPVETVVFLSEMRKLLIGGDANAIYSNLSVYRDCYAVTLEFAKMRSSLPRDTRYTIAQKLSRVLVDMMVAIYRANSSRNDKARLIAEMRRQVVEVQIYFRLLSDVHQLGAQKAAFFMDKVASIGKQLAAWHKSAVKESRISNGAESQPITGGRPECIGLRPGAVSQKVKPICGRVAPDVAYSVAKGGLTENTEVTS